MPNRHYRKHLFVIILFFLLCTNSFAVNKVKSGVKMLDGSLVPDTVIFYDDQGEQHSLDKFEGKTLLLVFWATWCSSCTKEMPDLDMLQKDFRKLPFTIIPVSQDYQGVEIVKKYYKDYGIRYLPIYHDFKNQLFKAMAIVGVPTAILISPEGKMLVSFIGAVNWFDEEIRDTILSNIPGNYPEPKNSYQEQLFSQPINKAVKTEDDSKKQNKEAQNLPQGTEQSGDVENDEKNLKNESGSNQKAIPNSKENVQ